MRSPHAVLGVAPGATPEEIKRAYRRRAAELHPDRAGPGRRAEWDELKAAYEKLCPKPNSFSTLIEQLVGDAAGRAAPWATGQLDQLGDLLKAKIGRSTGATPGSFVHRATGPVVDAFVSVLKREVDQFIGGGHGEAGAAGLRDQENPRHPKPK